LPRVFLDAFSRAYDESSQQAEAAPDQVRNR
jgi:hypothetical protein